jgi:hypothetical protein
MKRMKKIILFKFHLLVSLVKIFFLNLNFKFFFLIFFFVAYFNKENKPKGAAERCLNCDKSIEKNCPYSAKKIYLNGNKGFKFKFFFNLNLNLNF